MRARERERLRERERERELPRRALARLCLHVILVSHMQRHAALRSREVVMTLRTRTSIPRRRRSARPVGLPAGHGLRADALRRLREQFQARGVGRGRGRGAVGQLGSVICILRLNYVTVPTAPVRTLGSEPSVGGGRSRSVSGPAPMGRLAGAHANLAPWLELGHGATHHRYRRRSGALARAKERDSRVRRRRRSSLACRHPRIATDRDRDRSVPLGRARSKGAVGTVAAKLD